MTKPIVAMWWVLTSGMVFALGFAELGDVVGPVVSDTAFEPRARAATLFLYLGWLHSLGFYCLGKGIVLLRRAFLSSHRQDSQHAGAQIQS